MNTAPENLPQVHRWFGVECNNGAWDLLEAAATSDAELEQILHLAHASFYHWQQAGQPINQLRGWVLLAVAYHRMGDANLAKRFAESAVTLTEHEPANITDFDRATAYASASIAYRLAGDSSMSQTRWLAAQRWAESLDAGDRQVFDQLFPQPVTA